MQSGSPDSSKTALDRVVDVLAGEGDEETIRQLNDENSLESRLVEGIQHVARTMLDKSVGGR